MLDWLREFLAKQKRKRSLRRHNQKVRNRERDLREANRLKPRIFWGPPTQMYDDNNKSPYAKMELR
ncbi:hypothetical protein NUU61_009603 [Penicillium alfredii]|uniref:Uncharacterized protein n=1 Tax=Penicillium alfredii TaxID=1506179 RepID=A0A9W9EGF4_9EURO|nr:uncharacterized protein NUU61_009603 [Penicillium alfredii]KAJ5081339.1 hypothetical protein NUU61_009603 [Penicillium alfredii]